jgi:hypothetical protein
MRGKGVLLCLEQIGEQLMCKTLDTGGAFDDSSISVSHGDMNGVRT